MSVAKRKTSSGTTTEYHYDFSQDGKRYRGVCEGCTTERAALAYEKEKKEFVKKLASQKTATALVENLHMRSMKVNPVPSCREPAAQNRTGESGRISARS